MGKAIEGLKNQKWVSQETGCALALGADLLLKAAAIVALVGVFGSYWSHGPLTASGTPTLHQIGQFIANNWWGTAIVGLAILFGPAVALKAYDHYQKGRETATQDDRVADQQRQAAAAGMGAGAAADRAGDAVPASPVDAVPAGPAKPVKSDAEKIRILRDVTNAHLNPKEYTALKLENGYSKVFYKTTEGTLSEITFKNDENETAVEEDADFDNFGAFNRLYPTNKMVDLSRLNKRRNRAPQ